ncbi:hypothetical protein [Carboxylicivirga marina]|uniref:Cell division protein ZapA n=1 Tax=Carboxylicivirga marina TaxID=2800988 RepID=A0ABS1HHN0_9BACT|nr:hypothetical protein [Carboxylicivirga marina]MBK3516709.1 hypothetical protein [Carboxylicivirga marina]
MEKTIKINGKTYRIKETLRAILDYENNQKKQTVDSLSDQIKMLFYVLKNANRKKTDEFDKFTIGYEAFLDALDEDMELFTSLTNQEEKQAVKKK